jgi:hypothetical protein
VRKAEESRDPWDVYKLVSTTPAEQTVLPLDQSGCKLGQG